MTKNRLKIAKYGNCTKKHNILVGKTFSRIKCLSVKNKSAEILVGKKFSHFAKKIDIFADFVFTDKVFKMVNKLHRSRTMFTKPFASESPSKPNNEH